MSNRVFVDKLTGLKDAESCVVLPGLPRATPPLVARLVAKAVSCAPSPKTCLVDAITPVFRDLLNSGRICTGC
ncbi:MAG: hypothetical protein H6937_11625 [Burkholderiales bacterium]|nr:hypothetical protein [Burkholderiales bacterium]